MSVHEDSRVARIAALEVNQTLCDGVRLSIGQIEPGEINTHLKRLRNSFSTALIRASERSGGQYSIETTSALLGGDHVLVVIAVTRWA